MNSQTLLQGEKEMSSITISETTATEYIDIVFDGPPGPDGGRFVEVENDCGRSIRVGEWIERQDGFWALRIPAHNNADPMPADPMPLDQAKRLAGLWSAGKMIGGDPQAACVALLEEIKRLEKRI
jgi:hypothetical protein